MATCIKAESAWLAAFFNRVNSGMKIRQSIAPQEGLPEVKELGRLTASSLMYRTVEHSVAKSEAEVAGSI